MTAAKFLGVLALALTLWTLLIVGIGRGVHALHCADMRAIREGRLVVDPASAARARAEASCR